MIGDPVQQECTLVCVCSCVVVGQFSASSVTEQSNKQMPTYLPCVLTFPDSLLSPRCDRESTSYSCLIKQAIFNNFYLKSVLSL